MATDESPTVKRRRLGMLLKQFRAEAGMIGEDVSAHMDRNDPG